MLNLFTAQLLGNIIYSKIFSESKFILSLTKTKKELRETPNLRHYFVLYCCTRPLCLSVSDLYMSPLGINISFLDILFLDFVVPHLWYP